MLWASLVAQMVKNLPAMQETWVRSLGWEDPLEKGMATHSSILAWRNPWTERGDCSHWGCRVTHDGVTNTHRRTYVLHTWQPRGHGCGVVVAVEELGAEGAKVWSGAALFWWMPVLSSAARKL